MTNSSDSDFQKALGEVAGDEAILVTPSKAGGCWTKQNLCLRSAIVRKDDCFPISLGFKKFFNWGESPQLDYTPFSMGGGVEVLEKRDGSLLIVSQYKGQLIHRTRGTFDASKLDNGFEIELLKKRFPQAFELDVDENGTANYSLLYEWETPNNQIVIRHEELNLVLIGGVRHEDYSYFTQKELDELALKKGLARPETFKFDSVKEMLNSVSLWKGREGVVVYSKGGQTMRKIKAEDYLRIHRLKSELSSTKRLIEFYVSAGTPPLKEAIKLIETSIDFEVARRCEADLEKVCVSWERVQPYLVWLKQYVEPLKVLSRKEAALTIQLLDQDERGLAFKMLDEKPLEDRDKIKLIEDEVL